MKHLIIYSHLNPKSFTKAIVDKVEKVSKEKGDAVKIIDLYGDKFNPVLEFPDIQHQFMGGECPADVKKYQDMVAWTDHLTIVYPIWWTQMPAMLKGFFDRVFSNGFAYAYSEQGIPTGLLKGKTVKLYICTGNPNEVYEQMGMHSAQRKVNEEGIFGFSGMKAETVFFGNVAMGPDELRKGYLDSIK